jgi:excinuclease ABC subunit C
MTQPPENGPEDGPSMPDTGEGAKTREGDDEAPIESLELADAAARDLDEPGRFAGEVDAASVAANIATVVDAAWKPRATSAQELSALVERLPETPGVYVMRDRKGVIVYVGKARKLRARVRQYFNGTDTRMFVPLLAGLLGDIETVVTSNDKEALLLENTLIKKHKPRFNVKLRDDKQFLVLRLDPKAKWPRLELVRRMRQDGAQYFGPYHSANSARHTLRVVNRHFKLRTCTDYTLTHRSRPCLQHQIGRCPAPCVLQVDGDEYRAQVKHVGQFLEGRHKDLVRGLRGRMEEAATGLDFERAARLRDQLLAIETSLEQQQVVDDSTLDQDVFGMYREGGQVEFVVMHVRQGKLLGTRSFSARGMELPDPEVLGSFLLAYYDDAPTIPDEVLLTTELVEDDAVPLKAWLREHSGHKVTIAAPERGDRRRLVMLAQRNATASFASRRNRQQDSEHALNALQMRLSLSRPPRVIECYDISHIQGSDTVASMVVFVDGAPAKQRYRSFKVRGLDGLAQGTRQNDDFASMAEVLGRRLRRGLAVRDAEEGEEGEESDEAESADWALPDLIVIDGGKGQLGRVLAMARDLGVKIGPGGVDIVSLAKERRVEVNRGKAGLQKVREWKAGNANVDYAELARAATARSTSRAADGGNSPLILGLRAAAEEARERIAKEKAAVERAAMRAAGDGSQGASAGAGRAADGDGAATQGASAGAGRAAAGSSVAGQSADAGVQAADGGAAKRPGEALQNFVVQQGEEEDDEGEVRPERVFIPGAKEAIRLRPGTSELFLMTQIRDEAHRFAITHHRKRRGKRALHSALDEIQGVGPAIKKALLHEFGTVAAIAAADEAALQKVKGVGAALAKRLREELGGEA